jgi:PcfJ-like protein
MSAVAMRADPISEASDRVELLRDHRGVYGVAFLPADGSPQRQMVPEKVGYITRPDRLGRREWWQTRPVLQPIPRLGSFKGSTESLMAEALLTALLARAGIRRFEHTGAQAWWSDSPTEQAANRRRFHAYKRQAVCIVNNLVRQALAAGNQDALRAARRFPERTRWPVYIMTATSPRLLQLADTFPLLLCQIVDGRTDPVSEAVQMVERGARLRMVAAHLGIPMAYRRIHPALSGVALSLIHARGPDEMPDLVARFLPKKLPEQRRWIWAMAHAIDAGGGPYLGWVARRAPELGSRVEEVRAAVHDIGDWIRASYVKAIPDYVLRALARRVGETLRASDADLIIRPFSPDMSVRTVRELVAEWHEAVALAAPESGLELPAPWRAAGTIGGIEVVPLATAAEIVAEGRAMHHCVRSYIPRVAAGECYLFSARRADQHIATIEVQRQSDGGVRIVQMRGTCNALVPKPTGQLLRRWCGQRHAWKVPEPPKPDRSNVFCLATGEIDFDDGIPF